MTQGSPETYANMLRERGPLDTFELVRVATSDRIATVTLNDPEHLNSYTIRMTGELREALRRAEDAADVRVVILTGTGKAFSAATCGACEIPVRHRSSATNSSAMSSAG